jgi:hypothetical protein
VASTANAEVKVVTVVVVNMAAWVTTAKNALAKV